MAALAAGAALLAASALGRPTAPTGGTLRVLLSTDIEIDPARAYYFRSWQIHYATCGMLVNYPDAGGKRSVQLVPDLAAAMPTISRDGRVYTFRVRGDRRFSDGTQVAARNVAHAFHRLLDRRMQSPGGSFFEDIVGAKEVMDGKARRAAGIRVLPGNRMRFTLKKRSPDFLARLALPFTCAVKTSTRIDPRGIAAPVAGSGPYWVRSWQPRRSIELVRNRFYRGPRPQRLGRIVYEIGVPESEAFDRIERGHADWYQFGRTLDERFARSPLAHVNPTLTVRYLALDVFSPPFSNARLRRAVALAVDRKELAAALGPAVGPPTEKFLAPGLPGYRRIRAYSLSTTPEALAHARRLAAPFVPATAYYSGRERGPFLETLRAQLGRIGIDVHARDNYSCGQTWCSGDIEIHETDPDYADPAAVLRPVLESASWSIPSWHPFPGRRWLRRLAAADRLKGRARLAALGKLDVDLVRNAVPGVPFAIVNSRHLFSSRVGCFRFHRVYHVDLATLCLRDS